MTFTDTAIVVVVIIFIILLVWSRIMNQRMMDTVLEIKEIVTGLKK